MSYDIYLNEPNTDQVITFDKPHDFKGGTYALGGSQEAWLNITYNYAKFYYDTIDKEKGIRWLYDKTGEECLPVLKAAIEKLGTKTSKDYWKATSGNAGFALLGLIAFCEMRPDGVFAGD